jgi:hypothetical protein
MRPPGGNDAPPPNKSAPIIRSKLRSNDNDNNNNQDEDTLIASASKIHNDHNVVFFVPVTVIVEVADDSGTHPRRHLLRSMPSRISCHCTRRRRGRDLSSSKPRSNNDNNNENYNDDNNKNNKDAKFASLSKNNDDHNIVFIVIFVKAVEQ